MRPRGRACGVARLGRRRAAGGSLGRDGCSTGCVDPGRAVRRATTPPRIAGRLWPAVTRVRSHEQRTPATTSRTLSAVTRPRAVGRPVTDRGGQVGAGPLANVCDRMAVTTDLAGHAQNPQTATTPGEQRPHGYVATAVMTCHPGRFGGDGCPVTVTVAGPGHRN
jgi:hypothetical protein